MQCADGILLRELDRLLRPNGYFVYSAPPAYRKDKDFPLIWDKLLNLTTAMCWRLIAKKVQTAIWVKPGDQSCVKKNAEKNLIQICDMADDLRPSWNIPLNNCITLNNEASNLGKLPPRPGRLSVYSESLSKLGMSLYSFEFGDAEYLYGHSSILGASG